MNKSSKRTVAAPLPSSAVVISSTELDRLKASASIKTDAEILAEHASTLKLREDRERKARERKDRMRELEKIAAAKAIKTDSEIEQKAKEDMILELAKEKLDYNNDVVKLLNSMSARAVTFTLRDQQLAEHGRRGEIESEYNRRMDIIMEIDRLKDLTRREEDEKVKKAKRYEDRKVITEQIEYRQKQKILAAEAREQENYAMREVMKKYEEEDEVQRQRHLEEVERSKVEFVRANAEAIARKREFKEQEKKEVQDILIYQAMKDAEMAKREEAEAAIERAKKERQAQLLAQQERVQSNAGKLDELRARRAEEERERRMRQKEREDALKKKNDMKTLVDARIQQARDKSERQAREATQWKDQYAADLQYNKRMQDREDAEIRAKRDKALDHRNQLLALIEERKRARQKYV